MRAKMNAVSVTLPIFRRILHRGRLSGGLVFVHHFQNALILGQHGLSFLSPSRRQMLEYQGDLR
jgi:hypothetical protein